MPYENAPWNQPFEEEVTKTETTVTNSNNHDKNSDELTPIDEKTLSMFLQALSGKDVNGESKVTLSYQTYAYEEPEDSMDKERVYTTKKPSLEFYLDKKYPQFFVIDIIFQSYDDPELKMLWGRLQRFKKNMITQPEKTWVFYINILERASVTLQTTQRDTLFTANVFNPTLFYLSREIPNYLADDVVTENGELCGGNMIRMLVPVEFVTFEISQDIDTSLIKGEVMRENEAREYLNNPENQSKWDEY